MAYRMSITEIASTIADDETKSAYVQLDEVTEQLRSAVFECDWEGAFSLLEELRDRATAVQRGILDEEEV